MNKHKNSIAIIFIGLALLLSLVRPNVVYARNPFKQFFRAIRRGVTFVVNLPDKATRWMGPVLGPIAADVLTQNIVHNPNMGRIFRHAQQFDNVMKNVEEQKNYLNQVKKSFRDQAIQLRNEAEGIDKIRTDLQNQLLSGEIKYRDYKDKIIALDNLAGLYQSTADKFDQSADNIRPENITRILTRNVWQNMLRQIRDGVQYELNNEVVKFINPDVIKTLVAVGNVNMDSIINALISGDLTSLIGQDKDINKDELEKRIRDRIKDILKNNKEDLRANWKEKIKQIVNEEMKKLKEEKKKLPSIPKASEAPSPTVKEEPIPTGANGCLPGYEPCPRCGISCIQSDCNKIENGHWDYTGHCLCGSSGSINENPKDPNNECYYPSTYRSCPGCLYACTHFEEECPLPD
jgi:hypothetical protein